MAPHRIDVTVRVAVFFVGQGGFRHERSQSGVVGLDGKVHQLFLGDHRVCPQLLQFRRYVAQFAFDTRPGHDGECIGAAVNVG